MAFRQSCERCRLRALPTCSEFKRRQKMAQKAAEMAEKKVRSERDCASTQCFDWPMH